MQKTLPFPYLPTLALTASLLGLTGCMGGNTQPTYNPEASNAEQAASFIDIREAKKFKGVKNLALTGCNVMFATSASASASTYGGFGDSNRREASSSTIFTMKGLSEAKMQAITNEVCAEAEQKLKLAGFNLLTFNELKQKSAYQTLAASGAKTPYEIRQGDSNTGSRYLVFAREGETVWDKDYQSFGGSIKQGFKEVTGSGGEGLDSLLGHELEIGVARLNVLIDFAEMESDGGKALGGLASKNTAKTSGEAVLSVSGELKIRAGKQQGCYKSITGKISCRPVNGTSFFAKYPISSGQKFYTNFQEATTTGDKLAAGVTKALSILGAGSSSNTKRYEVTVTPASFTTVQKPLTSALIDMALTRAKEVN